jgi:hypothetical protein
MPSTAGKSAGVDDSSAASTWARKPLPGDTLLGTSGEAGRPGGGSPSEAGYDRDSPSRMTSLAESPLAPGEFLFCRNSLLGRLPLLLGVPSFGVPRIAESISEPLGPWFMGSGVNDGCAKGEGV